MLFLSILQHYLLWHYSRAFLEIFHVWLNFLWFVIHFFSLPQLLRSWFAPWKRMTESRGARWSFEALASYLIIGMLSRLVGFTLRTVILAIGLVCLLFTIMVGFAVYLFWITAPLAIIVLTGFGITLLFT
jgi:hypothetical protein